MKKDAFYFSHDTNAHSDPKIMILLSEAGIAGLGMYWILIEILHQEPEGKISEEAYKQYIKFYTRISNTTEHDVNRIEQVLNTSGLLSIEDGYVFSRRVFANKNERSNLSLIKQKAGKASAEARKKNIDNQSNRTATQQVLTGVEQTPTNKIKENKIKVNNNNKPHSFVDSEFYDERKFKEQFFGTKYQDADLDFYYESALNYSKQKNAKYIDWIAAVRNWMLRDMRESKFKARPPSNLFIGTESPREKRDRELMEKS